MGHVLRGEKTVSAARPKRPSGLRPWLFIGLMAVLAAGCGPDNETLTVDFSKTIPVTRPDTQTREEGSLRVAVT